MHDDEREQKEFLKIRIEKLERLREAGVEPYPTRYEYTHTAGEVHDEFGGLSMEALETEKREVRVCGRIMSLRVMGKASFMHISDGAKRLQIYVRRDEVGEESYSLFKKCFEVGILSARPGTCSSPRPAS